MDSGYEDVQRKLDEITESIQKLQESFNSLVVTLEPVLHEYHLQMKLNNFRREPSGEDYIVNFLMREDD